MLLPAPEFEPNFWFLLLYADFESCASSMPETGPAPRRRPIFCIYYIYNWSPGPSLPPMFDRLLDTPSPPGSTSDLMSVRMLFITYLRSLFSKSYKIYLNQYMFPGRISSYSLCFGFSSQVLRLSALKKELRSRLLFLWFTFIMACLCSSSSPTSSSL